jgi:nitroreductase
MSADLTKIVRDRRTIRKFDEKQVSEEQVEKLLELAMYAPNRLNRQPWHFVVVRDKDLQKRFADVLRIHPYLETASAVVVVCALPELSPTWAMDVSAAIENMLIGATSMGVGSAWVGSPDTVMWSLLEETAHDALAIPTDVRVVSLVALGHPAEERPPHTKEERFDPLKVHYGQWEKRRSSR